MCKNYKIIVCKCQWSDYYDYRIVISNGCGHVRLSIFEDENIISDLYVDEPQRRKGIATKLLDTVDKLLEGRKAYIVPLENWCAEWYKKRGYIIKQNE